MHEIEYAIYHGDEFIMIGTAEEIAERLGLRATYVRQRAMPSQIARIEKTKNPSGFISVRLDTESSEVGENVE